jgi:RNA-directed DNA polymerase
MSLLRDLALALEMSEDDIRRIVVTAPLRYKVFSIPKRAGGGQRLIAQPARELKALQRYVVAEKLKSLRIHPIATAYRIGKSIRHNASAHAKKRVIMKLDFRDFFHSIRPNDLLATLKRANVEFTPEDSSVLTRILFWHNPFANRMCLSIGAPSSPFISNVVMEQLDRGFHKIARDCSVVCTRYADDITLSGRLIEDLLKAEERIVRLVARSKQPRLKFNNDKRGIFTKAGRRIVTGLVITSDSKVSLGRDRKRRISAALHHISIGRNTTAEHQHETRGWLAYAKSVEPSFVETMSRKYPQAFRSVMSMPIAP